MSTLTGFLNKRFKINESGSSIRIEVIAGAALFLGTVVQPTLTAGILADAGMDRGAVFTAGTFIIILSCLMYAFWLNKPFMCGPSIGVSPWIAYTIIIQMGVSWQMALASTVTSGVLFLLLSFFGFREKILGAIPNCLKYAFAAGIGAFITIVGLLSVGIIVTDSSSFFGLSLGNLTRLPVLMGFLTMMVIAVLYIKKVKGAFLFGILFYTVAGLFLADPSTGIKLTQLPQGGLLSVVSPFEALAPTFMKFSFAGAGEIFSNPILGVGIIIFTIFFIDVFDTIGTLSGLCTVGGFVDEDGNIPDQSKMFIVDATATTVGGMLGVSMATTYIENSIGLAEGGRTGLTAIVNAGLFALTLFFAPLFLMVPGIATGAAIALIGPMMMTSITKVDFGDYSEALPAFFCMFMMPFTGNMGIGILCGIFIYVVVKSLGKREKVHPILWILSIVFILYIISQNMMFG
jgi:AGZA family xanthine/uracil permease-like MFS transporter